MAKAEVVTPKIERPEPPVAPPALEPIERQASRPTYGEKIVPAYGRQLMRRRFAGWHPLYVWLTFGEDWSSIRTDLPNVATIALKPRDYRGGGAGWVDFRCVAGAAVTVFDQVGAAGEFETPIGSPNEVFRNPFFDLLTDLAQLCGPLEFVTAAEIYSHPPSERPYRVAAARYAFECKLSDPGRSWPWWWPESLDKSHGEKIDAWLAAARSRGGGARVRQRAA